MRSDLKGNSKLPLAQPSSHENCNRKTIARQVLNLLKFNKYHGIFLSYYHVG